MAHVSATLEPRKTIYDAFVPLKDESLDLVFGS